MRHPTKVHFYKGVYCVWLSVYNLPTAFACDAFGKRQTAPRKPSTNLIQYVVGWADLPPSARMYLEKTLSLFLAEAVVLPKKVIRE